MDFNQTEQTIPNKGQGGRPDRIEAIVTILNRTSTGRRLGRDVYNALIVLGVSNTEIAAVGSSWASEGPGPSWRSAREWSACSSGESAAAPLA